MGNRSSSTSSSSSSSAAGAADDDYDEPEAPSQQQQMSYYQMAKAGYQQLVHAIIRPPRCEYDETTVLGPKEFKFCGKRFKRSDFTILNARKLHIFCSKWEPIESDRPHAVLPCVIYMHGNSSGRPEALTVLSLVLSIGATFMTFDFCGSGMSDGEYVSLGVYEKDDLAAVIDYLRRTGRTSTIALWGRSMGAATALLHSERDPSIAAMVLDSAYSDLTTLAEEMVEKGRKHGMFAPGILVRLVLSLIRSSIQKEAKFDIREVCPIRSANKSFSPALFVAARGDVFVAPHHSKQICDLYAGDKNLILVEGDHNSNRPFFLHTSAAIFLTNTLQVPESWSLTNSQQYLGGLKPWDFVGGHDGRSGSSSVRNENGGAVRQRNRAEGGSGSGSSGGGIFLGFDDDEEALQRVLTLSLMEQTNVVGTDPVTAASAAGSGGGSDASASHNTATNGNGARGDAASAVPPAEGSGGETSSTIMARRQRAREEPDGVSEPRANEAVFSTMTDISTGVGIGSDLGMTSERQQQLRNAIYNMFNGTAKSTTIAASASAGTAAGVDIGVGMGNGNSGGGAAAVKRKQP